MTTTITELQDEHFQDALLLYNHWVECSTVNFYEQPLTENEFRDLTKSQGNQYKTFAIFADGEFGGFCILSPYQSKCTYKNSAEITVYLKPEYTGKGLGATIVKGVEAHAKANAIRVLIAGICTENEDSIEFFKRQDYFQCAHFKQVGEKFGRVLDVVYYQKILSEKP